MTKDTNPFRAELAIENLHFELSQRIFFTNLSFKVQSKQLIQIKGPNGIGKTTLLRIIAGLLPATDGVIFWNKIPIAQAKEIYHAELAYLGHKNGLTHQLTVHENLKYQMQLQSGFVNDETLNLALKYFNLENCIHLLVGKLSAGQKKRLALARLLINPAKLWLLDEPLASLDQQGIELLKELISNHLQTDGMVIMTSHQTFHIEGVDQQEWLLN